MACWGSDALRGCSKLPHQGCLEVPKREDREHAQPLTWVMVFQAWRGSFFRKPVCSMLQYGNRADRDAKSNVEPAGPLASTMSQIAASRSLGSLQVTPGPICVLEQDPAVPQGDSMPRSSITALS